MSNPIQKLVTWIEELANSFQSKVPDPSGTERILAAVESHFDTKLTHYLGGGDNGIVFNTSDGTVIKFTIDNKEALLWAQLDGTAALGINRPHKIAQLTSSKVGDTIIYVVQTDFIPHPVTKQQSLLIRRATQDAKEEMLQKLSQMRVSKVRPEIRYKIRTSALVKAFHNSHKLTEHSPTSQRL